MPPSFSSSVATGSGGVVAVTLAEEGCYGKGIIVNSSVVCPPSIGAADCESFAVLGSDCVWRNATAEAKPGERILTLTPADWPATAGKPVGTRAYYANWPVVTATNAHGVPLLPWVEPVSADEASTCPKAWPPIVVPSPPPPPPPAPPPHPHNCSTAAPAGFTLVGRGWWAKPSYKLVGENYGSVADCAAACLKFGPICKAFHVWEPCPHGDCYVFLGATSSFEKHPGAFGYKRN